MERFSLYNTNIDFLRWRKVAMAWSIIVLLIAVGSLLVQGMNLGLDFTGGTVIEVQYAQPVEIPKVRETLVKAGFGDAQTQHFGTSKDVLIRIPPHDQRNAATLSNEVLRALQDAEGGAGATLARAEFVGPQVGQELVEQGGLAALGALAGILVYVMFRFEWRLAVGTIAATVHDVVFTVGWFSLFHLEFDLTVLAAVLAVIGYSVNDTVVVLDRIRENFRKRRKGSVLEIMNRSINETLSRTLMTSLATLLSVIVLYFLGGTVMHGFSIAMIVGILVGTYSSIYIASASALYLGISREDLLPKAKEAADERP
ncbi:protein translocase subunit SecF [Candidatus Competibacter phosphatis]|uniref:Protein-export membrane protein SecF n=1 Tax=Candidatus Competibacter phosphatis TaxID=221280 RepID=A0ABX1TPG7_9GAMM|nr:protein translocase subunit SecF [Candidatus Competibacter phosphatis]NMQ20300.1 protein translocase subunit SecF [Candidatus Competibacter phosphatis]